MEGEWVVVVEEINGEVIRADGSTSRSEQEHGMVHVSWGLDHIHLDPLLRMANRSLCFWLHSWHGLDHRQSCPFRCKPQFLSLSIFFFWICFVGDALRLNYRVWIRVLLVFGLTFYYYYYWMDGHVCRLIEL